MLVHDFKTRTWLLFIHSNHAAQALPRFKLANIAQVLYHFDLLQYWFKRSARISSIFKHTNAAQGSSLQTANTRQRLSIASSRFTHSTTAQELTSWLFDFESKFWFESKCLIDFLFWKL
jgi:hypothetical protein